MKNIIKKFFGLNIGKYIDSVSLLPDLQFIIHNHYYGCYGKMFHFHLLFEFINFYFEIRIGRDE